MQQIIPPDESVAEQKGEQWIVKWQNQWLPFKEMHSALGLTPYAYKTGAIRHPLLLIDFQNKTVAVAIDRLQNSFELVLKSLGHYVPSIAGLSGITQTGDGLLMPVLSVEALLERGTSGLGVGSIAPAAASERQTILVVDDSLSQRNALKLLLVDSGFDVQTATDGIDALEKVRLELPAVMLVDMEMPRMNGLELTQAIKSQSATSHIPIVMITSRSQIKHRQQAKAAGVDDYLTKPFNENEVVDTVLALLAQLPTAVPGDRP
ncbi:MAG: CheY-like chemotaxis protein [Granulosicoccus sp.]